MALRFLLIALGATALGTGTLSAEPPSSTALSGAEAYIPKNLRLYFVGLMTNPPQKKAWAGDLFIRHQNYIRSQYEAGVYRLWGPLTDGGHIRGFIILSADSIEQARAIVAADPAVQEGVFAIEVHPAMIPSLPRFDVEYHPKK